VNRTDVATLKPVLSAPVLCLVLLFHFRALCAFAGEYSSRTWQTEDGLPQHSGTAIVQTSDGYLWVGTFNGLARFNGVEFTRFTVANTKELVTDDINKLYEDRSGRLWIGTYSGVLSYERGQFKHWNSPEQLSRANVRSFGERSDGALLVATSKMVSRRS
jgi:ligand-binding sensor domain-containing protein